VELKPKLETNIKPPKAQQRKITDHFRLQTGNDDNPDLLKGIGNWYIFPTLY
jgi:Zn/Cd-binding protein ZinT